MTTIVVTVPMGVLLSSNGREHWGEKARRTKELRRIGRNLARGLGPLVGRQRLTVLVAKPNRRGRQEISNLHPTFKALIDGMVDAGLLPDDSDQHLIGPDPRLDPMRSQPGTYEFTFMFEAAS